VVAVQLAVIIVAATATNFPARFMSSFSPMIYLHGSDER
jgi:hypothetical protein